MDGPRCDQAYLTIRASRDVSRYGKPNGCYSPRICLSPPVLPLYGGIEVVVREEVEGLWESVSTFPILRRSIIAQC